MNKGIIITGLWYAAVFILLFFVIKHLIYLNKVTKETSKPI